MSHGTVLNKISEGWILYTTLAVLLPAPSSVPFAILTEG